MAAKKITFSNGTGETLSARVEFPLNQTPKAFALFAHCFTCNKNLTAVRNISKALTDNGFGVFRFDFTGLGESEGDFADSNFSSNVQDLLAAAEFMASTYQAPSLLIGHSLGGAAVLFAAKELESVLAVATIGAPASPAHVQHLFKSSQEQIEKDGHAEVQIGGRGFTIKKQFLDDLNEQNLPDLVKKLRKPILIAHSPQDTTVGIENAAAIYSAAMHPKSFLSLDGADHLLSNKQDSNYVGNMIANWSLRYLNLDDQITLKSKKRVTAQIQSNGYTTDVLAGKHLIKADEPVEVGGNDFGPTPYDYLLSALGACTAMTMRMYADRKGWKIEEINVHLDHEKKYDEDCIACEDSKSKIDHVNKCIEVKGDLSQEQLDRLFQIADKCPVHKTLHSPIKITTEQL